MFNHPFWALVRAAILHLLQNVQWVIVGTLLMLNIRIQMDGGFLSGIQLVVALFWFHGIPLQMGTASFLLMYLWLPIVGEAWPCQELAESEAQLFGILPGVPHRSQRG